MKATDAALVELARQAGVRPTVIFHAYHYRRAMRDAFSVEGFCTFTGLAVEHGVRVFEVLPADDPKPRRARTTASRTQLPADWDMPEDWLCIGREKRFWPMDVCRTEAERFANWHRMKGNSFADWKAAWRNWVDGSHREDGKANAKPETSWDEDARTQYLEKLRSRQS